MLAIYKKSGYNIKDRFTRGVGAKIPLLSFAILRRKKLSKIENNVQQLLEPVIKQLGYELYDVEYEKQAKDYYLRIYIDKENGIDLNDCERVSNAISSILDEADYIKGQYFLEVSSPGIERALKKDKHLEQNIGEKIKIKLFKKDDKNQKEYIGLLENFDKNTITIKTEDETKEVERKNIANIHTIYEW